MSGSGHRSLRKPIFRTRIASSFIAFNELDKHERCNQSQQLSVTVASEKKSDTVILTATHTLTISRVRADALSHAKGTMRRRSLEKCVAADSCVRKSFTRLAKLSVSLYTRSTCATNCRDVQTRKRPATIKAQLSSCIYVANLMQLRGCEWWNVACAPPRTRFRDNSRINNPEGERV